MLIFWIFVRIFIWCLLGYAGGWIAARKGYPPRMGIVVAVIFGPLALVVCALLPMTEDGREQAVIERQIHHDEIDQDRLKSCPACGREVSFKSRVCPRCEHRFESVAKGAS